MAAQQPGPARPAASLAPPLTMRIRRAHWVALDYVFAAVCALIIFTTLFHGPALARFPVTGWHARAWLPPVLAVCLSIPVAVRRREPVIALAMILAACAWVLVLRGELTRGPVLPLALVLYAVAAAGRADRPGRLARAAHRPGGDPEPDRSGGRQRGRRRPDTDHLLDDRLLGAAAP